MNWYRDNHNNNIVVITSTYQLATVDISIEMSAVSTQCTPAKNPITKSQRDYRGEITMDELYSVKI